MFYLNQLLMVTDEVFNVIFGGYADETISLRAARKRDLGVKWGCVLCKLLDKIVKNHCDHAIAREHESIIRRKL